MKAITEIQRYESKKIMTHTIEGTCKKLKNDLKWYRDDASNSNSKQNEKYFQENIVDKELPEKTVGKLVEEWWLSS